MDQTLFSLINHEWTSPGLDRLMAILSSLDCWVPILVILIVCAALFGGFKMRAMLVTLLIAVGIADGVVGNGLKHRVNRPRPNQVESVRVVDVAKAKPRFLAVGRPPMVKASVPQKGAIEGRSFPSNHTLDNFAALAVLVAFYPRRGWFYLPFALGVAYSRIYTGSHWPSDVLVSMFLGFGLGLAVVVVIEALWRRWGMRIASRLHGRYRSLVMGDVKEKVGA